MTGNDNVILGAQSYLASRTAIWAEYRHGYFNAVIDFLVNSLATSLQHAEATTLTGELRCELVSVENFWEFRSDNALRAVHDLIPRIAALGRDPQFRLYENAAVDVLQHEFSAAITFGLPGGRKCKIYAKTDKRLRIETTTTLRSAHSIRTSATHSPVERVFDRIDAVAAECSLVVQDLVRRIGNNPGDQLAPYTLVHEVVSTTANEDHQRLLLSLLIDNGGVQIFEGAPLLHQLTKLERRGVLVRPVSNGRFLTLAPKYTDARRSLANFGNQLNELDGDGDGEV